MASQSPLPRSPPSPCGIHCLFYFKYQGHAGPVSVSQDSQAQTCLVAFIFAVLSAWVVLFPALSFTVSYLWGIRIRGQILPQRGLPRPSCVRWQISAPPTIYFLSDYPFLLTTACLFIFTCLSCIGNIADPPILWKWKVKVTRLCLTLCNPMDYTVHGILQARILEGVAVPFSSGSSWPRIRTGVSCIAGGFFTSWATILWISSKMSFELSANSGLCRKRNFGKCSSSEVRMTQDKSTTDSAFFLWFRKGANIYWIPFMGQGPC